MSILLWTLFGVGLIALIISPVITAFCWLLAIVIGIVVTATRPSEAELAERYRQDRECKIDKLERIANGEDDDGSAVGFVLVIFVVGVCIWAIVSGS